jgi:hypothetical protein
MNGTLQNVREWIDWLKARPPAAQFDATIGHVLDDEWGALVDGRPFELEASYFSVRIAEMHLKNAGEYFRQFLPMAVTLAQFTQGGQPQALPFFLNNDRLREALGAAGAGVGLIRMKNVYALRHVPVNADGLALFCGLFRIAHQDFAAALLDLLAEIGSKVSGAAKEGVDVAQTVYSRLARIVGMKDVEFRFGSLDGAALSKGSGYRVFAGPSDRPLLPRDLMMVEGKLYYGADGHREEITGCDYCVVALERLESRAADGQLTSLPLHRLWNEVARHLAERRADEADAAFTKLQAEVLLTPDLTEADRLVALTLYQKKFAQVRDALAPRMAGGRGAAQSEAFRARLTEEIDRRDGSPAAGVAEALAKELRSGATEPDLNDISVAEARRLVEAFKGFPVSSMLSTDVANLFTAARQRSRAY